VREKIERPGQFLLTLLRLHSRQDSNPENLVNPVETAPRVLHNPLAHRRNVSFPMIGKKFSNGWKTFPAEEVLDRIYRNGQDGRTLPSILE
jgi:hypothetical protein